MRPLLAPIFLTLWVVATALEFQNYLQINADFQRLIPLLPYAKGLTYLAAVVGLWQAGVTSRYYWLTALLCNPLTPVLGWFLAPAFIYVTAYEQAKESPEYLWPEDLDTAEERGQLLLDLKLAAGFIAPLEVAIHGLWCNFAPHCGIPKNRQALAAGMTLTEHFFHERSRLLGK